MIMQADLDLGRILRFCFVGGLVALIYVALFLGLREFGFARGPASVVAYGCAVLFQYFAQTAWTFRRALFSVGYAWRFAVMVALGAGFSVLITAAIGPTLGLHDAVSAAIVVVITPFFNFLMMILWVYRDRVAEE